MLFLIGYDGAEKANSKSLVPPHLYKLVEDFNCNFHGSDVNCVTYRLKCGSSIDL
jgi:hypothetical protein